MLSNVDDKRVIDEDLAFYGNFQKSEKDDIFNELEADDKQELSEQSSLSVDFLSWPSLKSNNASGSSSTCYSNPSNQRHEKYDDEYICVTASDNRALIFKKATLKIIPYFRYITNPDNVDKRVNENGEIMLDDGIDLRYLQPIVASLDHKNLSLLLSLLPADCNVDTLMEMCSYLKVPLKITDNLSDIRKSLSNKAEIKKAVTELCLGITLGKYYKMQFSIWNKIYEILLNIFENKSGIVPSLVLFHLRHCVSKCFGFTNDQKEKICT